jgi:hypothetical protein
MVLKRQCSSRRVDDVGRHEARRIAANIAKLPELLRGVLPFKNQADPQIGSRPSIEAPVDPICTGHAS